MSTLTQTLIHRRMKCFVEFIAPEKDESPLVKEHFQQIKSRIEKHAKEEGYTVASVHYSGSYAKRTGLRRYMTGGSEVEGQDVDVAVILEDHSAKGRPIEHSLISDFKRYLKTQWPEHLVSHTKSSATLAIPKHQLRFDVVPLLKTTHPNIQKLIRANREVRTTSVQGHTEFIRNLNRQGEHIHYNNGLRLVKWWRYNQQINSRIFRNDRSTDKVPSFLLDLLCAKAYMELPAPQGYPDMLYQWFKYLHEVTRQRKPVLFEHKDSARIRSTAPWCVIDPMDTANNVVEKWPAHKVDELARWFQRGRDLMMQAMHFDHDGKADESLNCLKELFGPSIKTHCKQPLITKP